MQKIALLISLLGIALLLTLTGIQKPIEISSAAQLEKLKDNQKVIVTGKVIDQRVYKTSTTLILEKNLSLVCDHCKLSSLKEKSIKAEGIIDNFNRKISIKVLTLEEIP
jgi:hypothetical protein